MIFLSSHAKCLSTSFHFQVSLTTFSKIKWSQVARKIACYWCRAWQCQVLGIGTRIHGYPSSGRDERTEGQDITEELAEFRETSNTDRGGKMEEEKTTLWVIHSLSLPITPTIFLMQCNLAPCNSSFLLFVLSPVNVTYSCSCYSNLESPPTPHPPRAKPVEQLWLPLEKLTPLLAALKAAKLVLQACASA